jgi:hypothetical protein
MNWALIGSAGIILAGSWIGGPAWALPAVPFQSDITAAASPLLLSVRYHRHHWHHYWHQRHFSHWHAQSRWARGSAPERGADSVKQGLWQFTSELQTPMPPKAAAGEVPLQAAEPQSGGGIKTSYSGCITSEQVVPAELGPQCKLDSSDRDRTAITWSMTCTNSQGPVRSEGVAKYAGDTMEATMISHLPGGDGKSTDLTQHISGRYLGPCAQAQQ